MVREERIMADEVESLDEMALKIAGEFASAVDDDVCEENPAIDVDLEKLGPHTQGAENWLLDKVAVYTAALTDDDVVVTPLFELNKVAAFIDEDVIGDLIGISASAVSGAAQDEDTTIYTAEGLKAH